MAERKARGSKSKSNEKQNGKAKKMASEAAKKSNGGAEGPEAPSKGGRSEAEGRARPEGRADVATMSIEDGIAVITIDMPGKKVNTLSSGLFEFFESTTNQLANTKSLRAVVLTSGKESGFIAGADIDELKGLSARHEILEMISRAHKLLNKFEALPVPTVAAINGVCLGGGLELALCCRYRVATESKSTKLGFPEVQLGLIPGAGGTQRAPRLVGLANALDLILSSKQLDGRRAKKIGLVDEVVHPADLLRRARQAAEELAKGTLTPDRPHKTWSQLLLEKTPARKIAFNKAREEVLKKTGGHYPAPKKAIEVLERTAGMSLEDGLQVEALAFADLVVSSEAKSLMSIFFMKNDVDKEKHGSEPGPTPKAEGGGPGAKPLETIRVRNIGVLGAGLMGAGIGQVLAQKGYQIRFKDRDLPSLGRGYKYAYDLFQEQVEKRRMPSIERDLNMSRITGGTDYTGFKRMDMVIEAVFEDLKVKQEVLKETEAATRDKCIFASNTSSLPITDIAKASKRPERVIGMHFFSPVHKMPLVEVIKTKKTDAETLATTVEIGRKMGKTVIVVNDGVGFFTTRALGPYMNEASYCLQEGASVEEVDAALLQYGFPVGPMTLVDEVGIDVGEKVGKVLLEAFGDRMKPPSAMRKVIEDGRKGRKNGKGFFTYDGPGGKKGPVDGSIYQVIGWTHKPIPAQEIADRCWMQLLNETVRCMEDGIITEPRDIDIGVIFGFGFPPFRGGILHAADAAGIGHIVKRMGEFEKKYGERWTPAKMLVDMERAGKTFFPK